MPALKKIGLALLMTGSLSSAASAQVLVETYTATESYTFTLPGTSDGGGGLDFNYAQAFTTISFTPGSVTFNGQPVDFSGTESSWLSTAQTGTINIPVTSGPATVTATGSATASGPAMLGIGIPIELISLDLGASFSSSNLDILLSSIEPKQMGSDFPATFTVPVVPELNGAAIQFQDTATVTTVNPGAGTFSATTTGNILATAPAVPVLSGWRVLLLATALLGAGAIYSRRSCCVP